LADDSFDPCRELLAVDPHVAVFITPAGQTLLNSPLDGAHGDLQFLR